MAPQTQTREKESAVIHQFIGVWSLQTFIAEFPDGGTIFPLGELPVGQIIYDKEGRVSVQIMRMDRPRFTSGDPANGTPKELAGAFKGYLAYYGRYRVDESARTVTHILEACLYPNWVGSAQVRHYVFSGDILTLRTPPIQLASTGGKPVESTLVWRREG